MAATHPNDCRWGSVFVGGGGVAVWEGRGVKVVTGDDPLVVVVGEGVKGEEGGAAVVVDEVLSEVEDELLNVAFG